jgi:hypothetical protein
MKQLRREIRRGLKRKLKLSKKCLTLSKRGSEWRYIEQALLHEGVRSLKGRLFWMEIFL